MKDMIISDTVAFIAATRNYRTLGGSGGLSILDVSNPLLPTQIGLYGDGSSVNAVSIYKDYAYLEYCESSSEFSCTTRFKVLDIADPANPVEVYSTNTSLASDTEVYDHYLYKARNGQIEIFDLVDPENPAVVGSFSGFAQRLRVADDVLFGMSLSLNVFQLNDPANPTLLGQYSTNYWGPFDAAAGNDLAYLAYGEAGLRIIDISQPPIVEASVMQFAGWPIDAAWVGEYVYLLNQTRDLEVLSLNEGAFPDVLGHYIHQISPGKGIDILGTDMILYGNYGFEIVDITEPVSPTHRSAYASSSINKWHVVGDHVFLLHGSNSMDSISAVDISDRNQPVFADSIGTPFYYAYGMVLNGRYAYLSEGYANEYQLTVVDVSDPTQLEIVAVRPLPDYSGSVAYVNGYVYIASKGIEIFDVTNPISPTYTTVYTLANAVDNNYKLTGIDDLLYVTAQDSAGKPLKVILDVSNPTMPVEVGTFLHTNGLIMTSDPWTYGYVPDGANGLLIYRSGIDPTEHLYLPLVMRAP